MRRDMQYFYAADTVSVYNAFLTAAQNKPFERDCGQEPYSTINFGLNFSMKYNMNGGSCIINFFPTEGGTLVNLRFVVAQAFGARYERYSEDLTRYVNPILNMVPSVVEFDVDALLKTAPKVTPQSLAAAVSVAEEVSTHAVAEMPAEEPTVVTEPMPAVVVEQDSAVEQTAPAVEPTAAPVTAPAFCSNCGNKLNPSDAFCGMCGTKVAPLKRFCTNCGKQATATDIFCGNCGKKL